MSQSLWQTLRQVAHDFDVDTSKLAGHVREMLHRNWHLGFTSFGGPAVHFQIFHRRFVEKYAWVDDQMYKEMFSLCQALPGPGSTKMLFAINLIHGGFIAAILSFFVWSLPGAIAAYGLAIGVSNINDTLPAPVYALLSGLNAATVGIIVLAAVQLSQKAITDKLTRVLVFLGGSAGILYNALWYFPVLMVAGGAATTCWDYRWGQRAFKAAKANLCGPRDATNVGIEEQQVHHMVELQEVSQPRNISTKAASLRTATGREPLAGQSTEIVAETAVEEDAERTIPANLEFRMFSWKFGVAVIACFLASFIIVMVLRGALQSPLLGFSVFSNLYLAGTIIFGGGPVVIPLLREYVVAEGWVSSRDFLLGLAICQAFPGPNFNFAVYLGALAVAGNLNPAAGAVIGYVAIYTPGIVLHTGTMGLWKVLRSHRWFTSSLRGVNATAVGLIYTAVYRLWEQGFLSETFTLGSSLGLEPWWVVVTATSFVGGQWFKISAPIAIIVGGIMGMVWYGVVIA